MLILLIINTYHYIFVEPHVVQFVAVIHEDVTKENEIEHLKNICKTHIHVQSHYNPLILNLKLDHKRSNGKSVVQVIIIFEAEYLFILFIYITHFVFSETKG